VDMFIDIAEDFMKRIFNFDPGEYLISDESSLGDFIDLDENEFLEMKQQITNEYNIVVDKLPSDRLLEIFMAIHKNTYGPQ
jgi:hypothetical protein